MAKIKKIVFHFNRFYLLKFFPFTYFLNNPIFYSYFNNRLLLLLLIVHGINIYRTIFVSISHIFVTVVVY